MKKKFLALCLFLGTQGYSADPADGQPFKFGYINGMKFWEKNSKNMANKVPWAEFQKIQNARPDLFDTYHFGRDEYVRLPGFGSFPVNGKQHDGSCLWTHLGVKPEKLYDLSAKVVADLQEKVLENPGSIDDYAAMALELISFLDPKEQVVQEGIGLFDGLAALARNDETVRRNWLKNLEQHGGTEFVNQNKRRTAFRPLNIPLFFQNVVNDLNINITIFTSNSDSDTLNVSREFVKNYDLNTLYLLDSGNGRHYDVLIPKGEPVSQPIYDEMMFFLNFSGKLNKENMGLGNKIEAKYSQEKEEEKRIPGKIKRIKKDTSKRKPNSFSPNELNDESFDENWSTERMWPNKSA